MRQTRWKRRPSQCGRVLLGHIGERCGVANGGDGLLVSGEDETMEGSGGGAGGEEPSTASDSAGTPIIQCES